MRGRRNLCEAGVTEIPASRAGALVVGILGGILGGWIFAELGAGDELSWLGSLVAAIVGAVIILLVLRAARDRDAGARRGV